MMVNRTTGMYFAYRQAKAYTGMKTPKCLHGFPKREEITLPFLKHLFISCLRYFHGIIPGEAGQAKLFRGLAHRSDKAFSAEIAQAVSAYRLRDLFRGLPRPYQLLPVRRVYAEVTAMGDRRGTDPEVYLPCSGIPQAVDDLPAGSPSHYRIIYHDDPCMI